MVADPSVVMSYSQSRQIDDAGVLLADDYFYYTDAISKSHWRKPYVVDGRVEIREYLAVKNTIPNVSAVVFRRKALLETLRDNIDLIPHMRVAGDWMTYIAVLERGRIAYSPKSLNTHRRHSRSVTHATERLPHLLEVLQVQKRVQAHHAPSRETRAAARQYAEWLYRHLGLSTKFAPRLQDHTAIAPFLITDS